MNVLKISKIWTSYISTKNIFRLQILLNCFVIYLESRSDNDKQDHEDLRARGLADILDWLGDEKGILVLHNFRLSIFVVFNQEILFIG